MNKPSGTIDILPEDMKKRRWLRRKTEDLFQKSGLEQIDVPIYDFYELYKIRSGEKIKDDIFTFYDPPKHRADENAPLYALRPEFTASFARCYINSELMYRPKPQKFFYIGPCFRYDEPTKGRYRQFTQIGLEIFGTDTSAADAEMLIIAMDLMSELKIKDYLLRINDLTFLRTYLEESKITLDLQNSVFGIIDNITSQLRKAENKAIIDKTKEDLIDEYYTMMQELKISNNIAMKLENLLHIVGSPKAVLPKLKKIFSNDNLTLNAIKESKIPEVCNLIESAGISNYVIDCGIARGLDYYTNTVFEIDVPSLGKEKQICGGGRYNKLVEEFGGETTPALGFSFGFERILIALENQGEFQEKSSRSDVFIGTKEETRGYGLEIAKNLRDEGIRVETDIMARSFRATSKFVNKMQIPYLLFLGPREVESQSFTIKNFITGEQDKGLSIEEVINTIKK